MFPEEEKSDACALRVNVSFVIMINLVIHASSLVIRLCVELINVNHDLSVCGQENAECSL